MKHSPCVGSGKFITCAPLLDGKQLRPVRPWKTKALLMEKMIKAGADFKETTSVKLPVR